MQERALQIREVAAVLQRRLDNQEPQVRGWVRSVECLPPRGRSEGCSRFFGMSGEGGVESGEGKAERPREM